MEEEEGIKGEDEGMVDLIEDVIIRSKKYQKFKYQKEVEEDELEIFFQY